MFRNFCLVAHLKQTVGIPEEALEEEDEDTKSFSISNYFSQRFI
jgi:hypothetical protein